MLKALISGVADIVQHQPTEQTAPAPLKRTCAYLEAAGACLLIVIALFSVYPG